MTDRREFLRVVGGTLAASTVVGCRGGEPKWSPRARRKPESSPVAVIRAADYRADLRAAVHDGLQLVGPAVDGLRVVLKPNLVEFDPDGVVNTHPSLLQATIEAFRERGAREVVLAEGPGHRRDNEYLLRASGVGDMLRDTGARYVDLNNDAVRAVELASRFTKLGRLYLPETVLDADLLVSMPKLKTHHWAGVTLSMKNMFGVVPGAVYGWPKNILHWNGIPDSILDINAALEVPRFNIVDGIVGMEGNGPIQGEARPTGALVFGADAVAVDATCARLMTIDPWRIEYLEAAAEFLGNVDEERIPQLGEAPETLRQDYRVLDEFRHTKGSSMATVGSASSAGRTPHARRSGVRARADRDRPGRVAPKRTRRS